MKISGWFFTRANRLEAKSRMSIPIECPACEHVFSVPTRYGGKKGKCPECGTVFEAPKATVAGNSLPGPSSQPPSPPANGQSATSGLRIPLPSKVAQRVPTRIPEAPPINTVEKNETAETDPRQSPFSAFVDKSIPATSTPTKSADQDSPPRLYARRSNAPLLAMAGVLVILVIAGAIGIAVLNPFARDPQPSADATAPGQINGDTTGAGANTTAKKTAAGKPTDDELETLWRDVLPSICQVIVESSSGTTTDAGFVVDSRGWIATNYFAIRDARNVRVRFAAADETTEPFEATGAGLIAFSPKHDLAILAIDGEHAGRIRQLMLNTEYEPVADDNMVAVGWDADGKVQYGHSQIKRLVATGLLPPNHVTYLRERHLDDLDDLALIEHSLKVIDGVGGGPLLNLKGEAIGMNVLLDPLSKFGYAIPIVYVVALRDAASGDVTPFDNAVDGAAAIAPGPMPSPMPSPMPMPPEKPLAPIKTGSWDSIDLMKKLNEQGQAISWLPRTAAEYESLQQLARHVTDAKTKKDDLTIEEGLRDFLDVRSQEVLDGLGDMKWPDETELADVNKLAAAGLATGELGLFAYGRVVIPSASSQKLDGEPTVVFELIGTDTWVVLTVGENADHLKKGTRWLILGIRDETANVAIATNPGEPEKVVPLIHSKYLVGDRPASADK